jgi:hypothetical protein
MLNFLLASAICVVPGGYKPRPITYTIYEQDMYKTQGGWTSNKSQLTPKKTPPKYSSSKYSLLSFATAFG